MWFTARTTPTLLVTPSSSTGTLRQQSASASASPSSSPRKKVRRRLTWRGFADRTLSIKTSLSPAKKIDQDWESLDLSTTTWTGSSTTSGNLFDQDETRAGMSYHPLPLSTTPPPIILPLPPTEDEQPRSAMIQRRRRAFSLTSIVVSSCSSTTPSTPPTPDTPRAPKTRFDSDGRRVLVSRRQRRRSEIGLLNSVSVGNFEDYRYLEYENENPTPVRRLKKRFGVGDAEDTSDEELEERAPRQRHDTSETELDAETPETVQSSLFELSSNSTCGSCSSPTTPHMPSYQLPSLLLRTPSSDSSHGGSSSQSHYSFSPPKFFQKRASVQFTPQSYATPTAIVKSKSFLRRRSLTSMRNPGERPPMVSTMRRSSSGPILKLNSLSMEMGPRSSCGDKSDWRKEYRIEKRGKLKVTNPDILITRVENHITDPIISSFAEPALTAPASPTPTIFDDLLPNDTLTSESVGWAL